MAWACAQVEAEDYPVNFRLYVDQDLVYFRDVTSRIPFRLPPIVGRDTEIELTASTEVYNVAIASSMPEISTV
jgi:hypothetical protein